MGSFSGGLYSFLSGARYRIGVEGRGERFLNVLLPRPVCQHAYDDAVLLGEALGMVYSGNITRSDGTKITHLVTADRRNFKVKKVLAQVKIASFSAHRIGRAQINQDRLQKIPHGRQSEIRLNYMTTT